MEVAPLLVAAHALGGVAMAVDSDEADLAGMVQARNAVPWETAKVLCAQVVVAVVVDLDTGGTEVDLAVLVVAVAGPAEVAGAVAEVANGRAARKGLLAVAAFEGSEVQRDGYRPSWRRGRVEEAQVLQEVGFENEPPIEDREGRLQEHRVGRPAGAHPEAVEHCLGWASQSLADP